MDFQSATEALFFGTNELAAGGNVSNGLVMAGWPSGTSIRLVLFASLPEDMKRGLRDAVAQWPALTHGAVNAWVDESSKLIPDQPGTRVLPGNRNEIWAYAYDDGDIARLCSAGARCITVLSLHYM